MTPEEIREIVNSKVALAKEQLRAEYEQKYANAVQDLETQLRNARADLIHLEQTAQSQRDATIRGKGQMHTNNDTISKAEYARMLTAKLNEHSLEEILQMQALNDGIDTRNTDAFTTYLGIDERSMAKFEAQRRASGQA